MNFDLTFLRRYGLFSVFCMLLILVLLSACGPAIAIPSQQAPPPIPLSQQQKYQPTQLYDEAVEISRDMLTSFRENLASNTGWRNSWYVLAFTTAVFFLGVAGLRSLTRDNKILYGAGCIGLLLILVVDAVWAPLAYASGYRAISKDSPAYVEQISLEVGNFTLGEGVDRTQKREAENFQLIAAGIPTFGRYAMPCSSTIDHRGNCTAVTNWYSTQEVNCTPVYDDDGDYVGEDCDTKYIPDFSFLYRYYIVPGTQARYIFADIYKDMLCVNPDGSLDPCRRNELGSIATDEKRPPAIFLHDDWRAPDSERQNNPSANFYIPQLWRDLDAAKVAAEAGQPYPVITGYFVGKYFHWGFAANSQWATVYDGQYELLKSLVPNLPEPNGHWFNYQGLNGNTVSLETMLYSKDGDLPTLIDPVFFIGYDNIDPATQAQLNQRMREFQGAYGPYKQSINYVVIINQEVVAAMGGIDEAVRGVMGLFQDEMRFGLFRMPKNQTLTVFEGSADGSIFFDRRFETALPFDNDVVKRDIGQSMINGPLPLNWEAMMGATSSSYLGPVDNKTFPQGDRTINQVTLQTNYSPGEQAGQVIGLMYADLLPENAGKFRVPDPNSDECTQGDTGHPGYQRPQMCNNAYLQASIPISEDGRVYMHNLAIEKTLELMGTTDAGGLSVFFAFLVFIGSIAGGIYVNTLVQPPYSGRRYRSSFSSWR